MVPAVSAVARALDLMDEPNLREAGVKAQVRWRAGNATTVSVSGEAVNQAFDEPAVDAVAAIIGDNFGGLGVFINDGLRNFFPTAVYTGAVMSVVLAIGVDLLFVLAQRALTPWTRIPDAEAGGGSPEPGGGASPAPTAPATTATTASP